MEYLRIWKEVSLDEIRDHIILVDDTLGRCPGCSTIGIPLKDLENCPSCGREFKFVTSTEASGKKFDIVTRIRKKLPALEFVDYDDYIRLTSEKKAQDLFSV